MGVVTHIFNAKQARVNAMKYLHIFPCIKVPPQNMFLPIYLSNVFTNYFEHDAITGELAARRRAKFYVASSCTLVIVRAILWNRREHFVNNVTASKRTFPCWRLSWWFPTLFFPLGVGYTVFLEWFPIIVIRQFAANYDFGLSIRASRMFR